MLRRVSEMMVKEVDDDMWGSKNDNGNKYGILIN
jgi:hypothetical protein